MNQRLIFRSQYSWVSSLLNRYFQNLNNLRRLDYEQKYNIPYKDRPMLVWSYHGKKRTRDNILLAALNIPKVKYKEILKLSLQGVQLWR